MNEIVKSKKIAAIAVLLVLCISVLWLRSSRESFTLFPKMLEEKFYREAFADHKDRGHIYQKFHRSKLIETSVDTDRDGRRDAVYKHVHAEIPAHPAFEITHFKEDRDHDGIFEIEGMSRASEIILVAADVDSDGQMDHFFIGSEALNFYQNNYPRIFALNKP